MNRRFQLLYALFCAIWAAYVIRNQVSAYLSHQGAPLYGVLLCVMLLAVIPALLGYFLLFKAFPWVLRLARR